MKAKRWGLVAFVLPLWLLVTFVSAETYYVAQNQPGAADSNRGTEAEPWLTLAQAAGAAVAGDTVYIKAGVYQEALVPKNSGTEGKPITFQAFGDDPVFITCPKYKITGWQKVAGTQMVYEAASPVDWPSGVMGLKSPLVAVDGQAVPGPGMQWSLGVPGLKEVTDEPYLFGEEKMPLLRRVALAEGNKIRLNLGGDDPNQHEVQAVPKKFYGVEVKTDYVVLRGLTVVDVSAGFEITGNNCLIEYCIARDVWGDFVAESGFSGGGRANRIRRSAALNCFRNGISVGEGGVIEDCLIIGAGTRVPYRVAPEDTLGAPGWEWGTGWRTGTNAVGRYNVAADNAHFGWWIDNKTFGDMIYGNVFTGSDTGIYNEATCNDTTLLYNTVVNCGSGFVWRTCKRILGQYNYVADNNVGVRVAGWFQMPTPTDNIFRHNLVLRSSKEAFRAGRWSHAVDLTGTDAYSASFQVGTETGAAAYVDRPTDDWDLLEDNFYTVQPGGVFTRVEETAVPYWPDPQVIKEYRTLAEYQAATGRERGSQEREVGMEQFGLGLYSIRIPHSTTPHLAISLVGNPARQAIHVDPMETHGDEAPYFWRPDAKPYGTVLPSPWAWVRPAGPGFELGWSQRPFLVKGGPRLKLDVPAVVWLTATGKGVAEAQAEAGGWWSPSLPTVPGAKINFSFLVDGKDLKAPTEDTVVAWVRFASLTGQHVSRQFIAGKDDAGQLAEAGPYQGSFGWRKISGTVTAPEQAERFEVFFGLRPCEGRARFADLDLQTEAGEAPPPGQVPAGPVPLNMEEEVSNWIHSLD